MIVVTGAAGFIGTNLILALNKAGYTDILAVDDLTEGHKFHHLAQAQISDYMDQANFLTAIDQNAKWTANIEVIFHQGACSSTTEWNGRYMMQNNYEYSKVLFHFCSDSDIPFIYASSAAVYGASACFDDDPDCQYQPLNVYGYSKWLFDQYVLTHLPNISNKVVGLRYYNVYGPHEEFKGSMASVAWHFMRQLHEFNEVKLFGASHGCEAGEHRRDFIYVEDVVNINLWCWQQACVSGIYNAGTGQARTFNDIARTLIQLHGCGQISYITMPATLTSAYQAYTQAQMYRLQQAGYTQPFHTLETGLAAYYEWFVHNQIAVPTSPLS